MDGGDVATHNTTRSCWIVLDGLVYDVTGYLEQHPGGASMLLSQGGRVWPRCGLPPEALS